MKIARTLIYVALGLGLFACTSSKSNEPLLISIEISPLNTSISNGTTVQFKTKGIYSDSTEIDITSSVTWSSSNTSVAVVSNTGGSNGLVTALAKGLTTITATASTETGGKVGSSILSIAEETVSTIAGVAPGYLNGIGVEARFSSPYGITTDGKNLYVADSGNYTIRRIEIATGQVSTLAATSGSSGIIDGVGQAVHISYPIGITTDGTNLYVTDGNNAIQKIVITTGQVITIAGGGSFGSADGIGTAAHFNYPQAITTDGTNLYVSDTGNNTIRKIVIGTGQVVTLAGAAGEYGSADGTGAAARFNGPRGIVTDGTNLYVADVGNSKVRKIEIATGYVTSFPGFFNPAGVTIVDNNLYVTDSGNHTVRKVLIASGQVSTIAGTGSRGFSDGTGTASSFYDPQGIATDGYNLYIVDTNGTIRQISIATGEVSTIAGTASPGSSDGIGSAARFDFPEAITTDGTNLYVADTENFTVRKILITTREVTTLAGFAGLYGCTDGIGASARFYDIGGIATDGINVYVSDTSNCIVRKIVIESGQVSTIAGTTSYLGNSTWGTWLCGSADGIGAAARFNGPQGLATDGTILYVADAWNHTLRKVVLATGEVSTLAGMAGEEGSADGIGAVARFGGPNGLALIGNDLYVADSPNYAIRKVETISGKVTTFAGTAGAWGTADGIGEAARFGVMGGITTDSAYLYVADSSNQMVRKISIATREVSTVAGIFLSPITTAVDGTSATATFSYPSGITTDGISLYITDAGVNTIRRISD